MAHSRPNTPNQEIGSMATSQVVIQPITNAAYIVPEPAEKNDEEKKAEALKKVGFAALVNGEIDFANIGTIFLMHTNDSWILLLEESLKYFMFPIAAAASTINAILAVREAYLKKDANSITKAGVEVASAVSIVIAVTLSLAGIIAFVVAAPWIFTAVFAAKTIYHATLAALSVEDVHYNLGRIKKYEKEIDAEREIEALKQATQLEINSLEKNRQENTQHYQELTRFKTALDDKDLPTLKDFKFANAPLHQQTFSVNFHSLQNKLNQHQNQVKYREKFVTNYRQSRNAARDNGISTVVGALGTPAVALVMALKIFSLAFLGVMAGLTGIAFLSCKLLDLVETSDKKKLVEKAKTETQDVKDQNVVTQQLRPSMSNTDLHKRLHEENTASAKGEEIEIAAATEATPLVTRKTITNPYKGLVGRILNSFNFGLHANRTMIDKKPSLGSSLRA